MNELELADKIADLLMQGLTTIEIKKNLRLEINDNKYLRVVYNFMKLNPQPKTQSQLIKEIESELFICLDEYKINPCKLVDSRIESLKHRYSTILLQ
jgi:histidyl-tRNA synthetase